MEANRSKKKKTKALIINISKEFYNKFEKKCIDIDQDKEKVIEELIKEWID